ncbi:MAG: FtsW/RodA/SpoVE family cell cycle protein [Bacteroidales bacterium]|nr:FtsW/RodA/SpoVE family cell cycle protein [Bacteroidales bacterium]
MLDFSNIRTKFNNNEYGDKVIWIVVFALSILSLLTVWSSTGSLAYRMQGGNTTFYFIKHGGLMLFGLIIMYGAHTIPYKYYSRISQLMIYISIPLLIFTLLFGTNLNQASRWLTIPVINLSFQTSDLAKLALIMFLARMLSKKEQSIKDFKGGFIPLIIPILLTVGLIFPANFSTATILFATSIILLFIGRINMKYIMGLALLGIAIAGLALLISNSYPNFLPRVETWKSRLENFSDKESEGNFQADQSKIAISTGGIFGKLPGNSVQRNFLPHPYSDFIYAIIIEEYGLMGGFAVIIAYLTLLFRAIQIAVRSPGSFGGFLAIGLMFSLVFQAFINMGVTVNLLPVTGQPLPMLSMGGTSLWFTSFAIGIVLSVSKEVNKLETAEEDNHE